MRAPFSGAPKASLTSKALTACAAATLALGLGVGTASALPPGGAKASTPGTSSTVSSSVSEHGVISFSVSGFPANTVVSVKVDDGNLCPSDAAQGACVVHQQKTDGNGNVSGSFVLPDVGAGTHTLRFLATGEKRDKDGKYLGTEAYSNRSPEFTVVGEGGSDNSSSNSSGSPRTAALPARRATVVPRTAARTLTTQTLQTRLRALTIPTSPRPMVVRTAPRMVLQVARLRLRPCIPTLTATPSPRRSTTA